MAVGQRAALLQEFHRALVDSAFPENRLQHNRAGIVVHRGAQPFQIVLLHKRHVFEQRLESLAMLVLPRQRQCPERPPVIRPFQRHQPALRLAARAMSRQPRQLDRSLDRLGPAVREERAIQSRRVRTTSPPAAPDTRGSRDSKHAPASPPARESPSRSADARAPAHSLPARKQNPDSACPRCRTETRPCRG